MDFKSINEDLFLINLTFVKNMFYFGAISLQITLNNIYFSKNWAKKNR